MADTVETIKCPACQREMTKIFIPSENLNLDICLKGCGGIFFDNREFKHFEKPDKSIDEILKAIEGKNFIEVDDGLLRICPVCRHDMVKNYSSMKKDVLVDECYFCGGKFLDHGELTKIREQNKPKS